MSLWELTAAVDGYNRAHGGEQKTVVPSDAEFEAAKALHGDD